MVKVIVTRRDKEGNPIARKTLSDSGTLLKTEEKRGTAGWVTTYTKPPESVRGDPTPGFGEVLIEESPLPGGGKEVITFQEGSGGQVPKTKVIIEPDPRSQPVIITKDNKTITRQTFRKREITYGSYGQEILSQPKSFIMERSVTGPKTIFKGGNPYINSLNVAQQLVEEVYPSVFEKLERIRSDNILKTLVTEAGIIASSASEQINLNIENTLQAESLSSAATSTFGSAIGTGVTFELISFAGEGLQKLPGTGPKVLGTVVKYSPLVVAVPAIIETGEFLTSDSFSRLSSERKGEVLGDLVTEIGGFAIGASSTRSITSIAKTEISLREPEQRITLEKRYRAPKKSKIDAELKEIRRLQRDVIEARLLEREAQTQRTLDISRAVKEGKRIDEIVSRIESGEQRVIDLEKATGLNLREVESKPNIKDVTKDLLDIYGLDVDYGIKEPLKIKGTVETTPKGSPGFIIKSGEGTIISLGEGEIKIPSRSSQLLADLFSEVTPRKSQTSGPTSRGLGSTTFETRGGGGQIQVLKSELLEPQTQIQDVALLQEFQQSGVTKQVLSTEQASIFRVSQVPKLNQRFAQAFDQGFEFDKALKFGQALRQEFVQGFDQTFEQRFRQDLKLGSAQAFDQVLELGTDTTQDNIQIPDLDIGLGFETRTPQLMRGVRTPKGSGAGLFDLSIEFGGKKGLNVGSVIPETKYKPSIAAFEFDITGEQPDILTGLGIRPKQRKRRRKKRKR